MKKTTWLLLAFLTGCAGLNAEREQPLLQRAAFDLNCPREQLHSTPLETAWGEVTMAGVSGCGSRATYVRRGLTWIMNSTAQKN